MKKYDIGFAAVGSVMSIIFIMLVNYLTSSQYPWFIYPSILLLLWPIGLYSRKSGNYKLLSIICSTFIIGIIIAENFIYSPNYAWSLYAIYPILWWPILVLLGKKAKMIRVAIIGSLSIILYYSILNGFFSPGYLWSIYPSFVVLWWPLSLFHARKKTYYKFSIHASILLITFFICINIISTPHTIWAVYPIFCVLWWPLSMYYFVYKRNVESNLKL
ncbi:hypothetical protein [Peribacillus loiseleuriae]|nr:hypothetical protein [Peribacillus loiseleuriae]